MSNAAIELLKYLLRQTNGYLLRLLRLKYDEFFQDIRCSRIYMTAIH